MSAREGPAHATKLIVEGHERNPQVSSEVQVARIVARETRLERQLDHGDGVDANPMNGERQSDLQRAKKRLPQVGVEQHLLSSDARELVREQLRLKELVALQQGRCLLGPWLLKEERTEQGSVGYPIGHPDPRESPRWPPKGS